MRYGHTQYEKNNSFLELCDIYGHNLNLRIFGKEKYKTFIGSIFSIVSLLLIISASIYFIIDLFQRKSLTVIYNEDFDTLPTNNLTDIPLTFALGDFTGKTIPSEGVYNLDVKMAIYKLVKTSDGVRSIALQIVPIQMEKCDLEKHFSNYKDKFNSLNTSNVLCIPPDKYNLTLFGKPRDVNNGWSTLNLYINKCDPKVQKCLDNYEKYLSNFVFLTGYLSNSINHYNTTSPKSLDNYSTSFRMSNSLVKSYQVSIRQNKYKTDNGFIFEENETIDFFTTEKIWTDVSLNTIGELTAGQMVGKLIFENSMAISNYSRSYIKGQAVMANIGGIIKAIMVISKIMSDFLSRYISYIDISNSIFRFNFDDSSSENKKVINTDQVHPQISKFNNFKMQDQPLNANSSKSVVAK